MINTKAQHMTLLHGLWLARCVCALQCQQGRRNLEGTSLIPENSPFQGKTLEANLLNILQIIIIRLHIILYS